MSDREFDRLLEENKDILKEIFEFWRFVRNLNMVLRWLVYIGAPVAIGTWAVMKWWKEK